MFVDVSCSTGITRGMGESFKISFVNRIPLLKDMAFGGVSAFVTIGVRQRLNKSPGRKK
jgi:hypothetical protein